MDSTLFDSYMLDTYREDLLEEIVDDDVVEKVNLMASKIKQSKYCVFYTGAGISTSVGLPDYRSKNGIWTKRKNNDDSWKQLQEALNRDDIAPSQTHRYMSKLVTRGIVKSVLTTNIDGLHMTAGLDRDTNLIEMHGNKYIEECRKCGLEFLSKKPLPDLHNRTHKTGNKCPHCSSELYNNIVLFGDTHLDVPSYEKQYDRAFIEVCRADLIVVWGSSLLVPSACDLVDYVVTENRERRGELIIINNQKTPKDPLASLIIHFDCDKVTNILASIL